MFKTEATKTTARTSARTGARAKAKTSTAAETSTTNKTKTTTTARTRTKPPNTCDTALSLSKYIIFIVNWIQISFAFYSQNF